MSGDLANTGFKEDGGAIVIERRQDVEGIIEHCKTLAHETDGKSKSGDMYHAASIPAVVVEMYCNTHGITFREFMINSEHVKRICNDPTFEYFRVWKGKV